VAEDARALAVEVLDVGLEGGVRVGSRHLDYVPDTPIHELGPAALDSLLERGDLGDWAPLLRAVAGDSQGPTAETVLRLCEAHPMHGTTELW